MAAMPVEYLSDFKLSVLVDYFAIGFAVKIIKEEQFPILKRLWWSVEGLLEFRLCLIRRYFCFSVQMLMIVY